MWKGVTARFTQFAANLKLTGDQTEDGATKRHGVTKCLNQNYYGSTSETDNSILVGSWGKHTRMRPPRDIDLLYRLPFSVYERFEKYSGNKQSALLQEVKGTIEKTYSTTTLRADGQVVLVRFNSINIEVVPAFELNNGQYWICDTNEGGRYKNFDPVAEQNHMATANSDSNGNARLLTKYIKGWQRECNVPLKSFWLELLAVEFLSQWQYKLQSAFYHDWMTRDFLEFLRKKRGSHLIVPGTGEIIGIGDDWYSKAESAYDRAYKAERFEYNDDVQSAGAEWQKIFGTLIPIHV